jgi:hypothetical protein
VIKKEAQKILNYKDFGRKIKRMWNLKTKLIPMRKRTAETT